MREIDEGPKKSPAVLRIVTMFDDPLRPDGVLIAN